jgi:hypothetical protein
MENIDQRIEKLVEMVDNQLNELEVAVANMRESFEIESSSIDASSYMEDVAIAIHMLTQTMSLHGYFEMVKTGEDPLDRF